MAKDTIFLSLLILLFSRYVESDLFYDVLNKVDPCEAYCEKTYPGISVLNVKYGSCCRQGCRFFTLVHLVDDKENTDLNTTKDACQASCMEAYSHTKDRYACNLGCASMAKQKKIDSLVAQISWSVYVEDGNSVLMLQPAGDFEPDDVLTDPGLRRQLEHSWGFGNRDSNGNADQGIDRLPETHVKTLPIEGDEIDGIGDKTGFGTSRSFGGDWLDCAARKSGLPRLLLAGAVMFAVLLALWLCLAPERRPNKLEYFPPLDDPKDPFDCPPKYSLHVDKV
ncbi:transmembrane protein 59-like isoform X1 [Periplaneta americana]|uniref:transmembrane protein 59-like isoform X1 n=1 Tax=Periplaneta americana TaxID=6978 RepID=UPI0037E80769